MICSDCEAEGADCLTADRVRICESCLYERCAKERDRLRDELERMRRWTPTGTYSVAWDVEQEIAELKNALRAEQEHLARVLKESGERERETAQQMRKTLEDALDLAEEGWAYADDYYKVKWHYEERLAALKDEVK